jgi:hypothetical protein
MACWAVSALLGRPGWPFGVSISAATFVGDVTAGLGLALGPGQGVVRECPGPAGIARRYTDEGLADVVCGQQPQLDTADYRGDQLEASSLSIEPSMHPPGPEARLECQARA